MHKLIIGIVLAIVIFFIFIYVNHWIGIIPTLNQDPYDQIYDNTWFPLFNALHKVIPFPHTIG